MIHIRKTQRLEMRLSPTEKKQIDKAAKQVGESISKFITETTIRRCRDMGIYEDVRTNKNQIEMFKK